MIPEITSTKIADYMKMYYRTHCHKTYGGIEWLAVLVALGDVPPLAVDIANDLIRDRIREHAQREATSEPTSGPRLSARHAAKARAEPMPDVRGPSHNVSEAKQARMHAKYLEKQLHRTHPTCIRSSACAKLAFAATQGKS